MAAMEPYLYFCKQFVEKLVAPIGNASPATNMITNFKNVNK